MLQTTDLASHLTRHRPSKMKKIILTFPSADQLWAFKKTIDVNCIEVFNRNLSLLCSCTESQIALATTVYKATVTLPGNETNQQKGKLAH